MEHLVALNKSSSISNSVKHFCKTKAQKNKFALIRQGTIYRAESPVTALVELVVSERCKNVLLSSHPVLGFLNF